MIIMGRPVAKWLGSGAEPRILAGFETTVRLEKHRHKKPGERVRVTFHMTEAVPAETRSTSAADAGKPAGNSTPGPAPEIQPAIGTHAEAKADVA